ncbi:MAG: SGNH/GDSL hydrolase family protein [Actinomycetota bacterium]|nr:SGNH/GDSL hydrolase family protein [Actinomycetota bacterium]
MTARFARYVALGDSQTEGLDDPHGLGGYRGWADRFAERLAEESPDLLYANLAVRGCRATHVRHGQLDAALALQPDLATVVVGMNDLLRHDYDLEQTVDQVEETFQALVASGAQVLTMTFPNIGRMLPVMGWLLPRQRVLTERLRAAAARHGVPVLDLFELEVISDVRMWSRDRIHGSAQGHALVAAGMAELVRLPGVDGSWSQPLPDAAAHSLFGVVARDAHWTATFLVPFLYRQLRGHSPGSGRTAKRPRLEPVRATPRHAGPSPERIAPCRS